MQEGHAATSPLMATLVERGFVKDCTDMRGLDAACSGQIAGYIGFDATAPALHVGSLIQLMVLRRMDAAGMTPIALIGGATTQIGDPSDKDQARPMLSESRIRENAEGIRSIILRIAPTAMLMNNMTWFGSMDFLRFQREFGRHFSVNRMLAMESVKRRLDRQQNMSALEFSYMMMQAVDFLELRQRVGCVLQIGGSDQWSNIIAGVDLVRRIEERQVFGLTTPLLLDPQGRKMGKTADGKAIWLDADMTSPFDLWQFFRNVPDELVEQFLGLFTDIPMEEVRRLGSLGGSEINQAKIRLADEAVAIVHGADAAAAAHGTAQAAFAGGQGEIPSADASAASTLAEILVQVGFASSKGDARRLAAGGGVRLDGARVDDVDTRRPLPASFRLSAGKKRVVSIRVRES
jgi:tyrosyl-tRNA synthetase